MKKTFTKTMMMTALLMASSYAQAFRLDTPFGEVKGEDAQIIKDTVKATQKLGTEIGNGVRETSSAVGNATGISTALEHNSETISHVGRAGACMVTLCYSEYHRQRELERLESEQKEALRVDSAAYAESLSKQEASQRLSENTKRLGLVTNLYKTYSEQSILKAKELEALTTLNTVILAELTYRAKVIALGAVPEASSKDMTSAAEQFQQDLNEGLDTAFFRLEPKVQQAAVNTGRSIHRIRAEVFRMMNEESLKDIGAHTNAKIPGIRAELIQLRVDINTVAAEMSFLQKEIQKGNSK